MVVGGYNRLVEGLAAALDVRLGSVVRKVEYGESGVTVTTAAGEKLEGAAAIITVPLGVLKSGGARRSSVCTAWLRTGPQLTAACWCTHH